jgi:hypothetical protein
VVDALSGPNGNVYDVALEQGGRERRAARPWMFA